MTKRWRALVDIPCDVQQVDETGFVVDLPRGGS
jgi:hypothetical protein